MYIPALASSSGAARPAETQAPPAGGFAQALAAAQKSGQVDPADEYSALQELLHIVASLSCGQPLDYPSASTGQGTPGPMREQVEALKEVLRRLISGGRSSGKDPVAGQNAMSLDQLFQSLPPELRNLLRKAFPDLDQMLVKDQAPRP